MNKSLRIAGIAVALVAVVVLLVAATGVSAQGQTGSAVPAATGQQKQHGNGAAGGLGLNAVDQAEMHAAIAEALGMTVAEFEAAVAAGESPYTLAFQRGIDFATVRGAMMQVHTTARTRAMEAGALGQPMGGGMRNGNGMGMGAGRGMGNGMGAGNGMGNQGDCPNVTP